MRTVRRKTSNLLWLRVTGLLMLAGFLTACGTTGGLGESRSLPKGRADVFSHDDFDRFLARHVDVEGRLAYVEAARERADLDRYLDALAETSPDSHPEHFRTEADRLAYWINAYNASVIDRVLAHYPIASVQDVRGPWLARLLPAGAGFFVFEEIRLGGKSTRLYSLENGLIRKRFSDPRIHFALNCTSASCPRLPAEAFEGDRLEAQLARETRRFLGEERNVEVDSEAGVVRLSSIFDWYTRDFRSRSGPRQRDAVLLSYLAAEVDDLTRDRLEACRNCRVDFVPYDWSLNDRS